LASLERRRVRRQQTERSLGRDHDGHDVENRRHEP
jgi:hypothetical protein